MFTFWISPCSHDAKVDSLYFNTLSPNTDNVEHRFKIPIGFFDFTLVGENHRIRVHREMCS